MPFRLLKYGLSGKAPKPHFRCPDAFKSSYDLVIIGAGGHGVAAAYYLARDHGHTNIAIIDKAYLGAGNTGRNTAVIRSNYLTEQGVAFYRESLKLFRELSNDFDYNIMYSERGQLTLAHSDASIRSMRWRAEINKLLGVRSEIVDRQQIREIVPDLNLSSDARYPVLAGLWHEDGATARHDAVAWGFARGACRRGVELHQGVEAQHIEIANNRPIAVHTNKGRINCGAILQAVAGSSSVVAKMAGIRLPIVTYPLQAMVTMPVKPFLDPHVSSPQLHCYVHQTSRGELVIGGGSDPFPLYSTRSTLEMKESLMSATLEMFPFLSGMRLLRQWAGSTDMTPDYSPIMGCCSVDNYYLDAGWGTWGFKATPVCGKAMAELIATQSTPDLIKPFSLQRFYDFTEVNERGATAASH